MHEKRARRTNYVTLFAFINSPDSMAAFHSDFGPGDFGPGDFGPAGPKSPENTAGSGGP